MRTLNLKEMEELDGGSCGFAVAAYGATIVIGALAGGPFGYCFASIVVASLGVLDGCVASQ